MKILAQQFDFSKQQVSATSKHITLQPGDKVIWRKTNRRMYGVSFDIKCTVVKVGAKNVKVLCRWKGRTTGEIRTEERSVPIRSLYRHDWQEQAEAKPKSEADMMDECLADLRSGKTQPIIRYTDEMMAEIESERF